MGSNIHNIKNHIKFLFMRMLFVAFLMAVILWQAIEWSRGVLLKSSKYLRKIIDRLRISHCFSSNKHNYVRFRHLVQWRIIIKTTSSQAPSYASPKLSLTHSLARSLTGVKCRATSVAKNSSRCKCCVLPPK